MPKSPDLFFVSSNADKYREVQAILDSLGIHVGHVRHSLEEIQSHSLEKIAEKKARDAFDLFRIPVIVEDAGLFVQDLGGFPGPFSSYVFQTIGNRGILQLMRQNRNAMFVSVVAFCSEGVLKTFGARLSGRISRTQKGKGWGYDPIFIAGGEAKTFAQLDDKDTLSHRFRALKKFSRWYLRMRESNG